ncbi:hypothetical protein [Hydrogenimonas sp.]
MTTMATSEKQTIQGAVEPVTAFLDKGAASGIVTLIAEHQLITNALLAVSTLLFAYFIRRTDISGAAKRVLTAFAVTSGSIFLLGLVRILIGFGSEYYTSIITIIIEIFFLYIVLEGLFALIERYVGDARRKRSSSRHTIKILAASIFIVFGVLIAIDTLHTGESINKMATFAFIGLLFAVSAGVWMPDIYAGIAMIFSRYINEEDIIEIKEKEIFGRLHRIGLVFSVIRDIPSNHMVVVRNTVLRDARVDNLSKEAGVGGIREKLLFKIGYLDQGGVPLSVSRVYGYFAKAADRASEELTMIQRDRFEFHLEETGDYALHFAVFYRVHKDSIAQRLPIRYKMTEIFYECAVEEGIDLSTPALLQLSGETK